MRQVRRSCKLILTKQSLSTCVHFVFIHFSHIVKPQGSTTTRRCRAYSLINGVGDPTCRAYRHFHSRRQQSRSSFLNGKLCQQIKIKNCLKKCSYNNDTSVSAVCTHPKDNNTTSVSAVWCVSIPSLNIKLLKPLAQYILKITAPPQNPLAPNFFQTT